MGKSILFKNKTKITKKCEHFFKKPIGDFCTNFKIIWNIPPHQNNVCNTPNHLMAINQLYNNHTPACLSVSQAYACDASSQQWCYAQTLLCRVHATTFASTASSLNCNRIFYAYQSYWKLTLFRVKVAMLPVVLVGRSPHFLDSKNVRHLYTFSFARTSRYGVLSSNRNEPCWWAESRLSCWKHNLQRGLSKVVQKACEVGGYNNVFEKVSRFLNWSYCSSEMGSWRGVP